MENQGKIIWAHLSPKIASMFSSELAKHLPDCLEKAANVFGDLAEKHSEPAYDEARKIIKNKNKSFSAQFQEEVKNNILDWGRPISSKKHELSLLPNELLEDDILVNKSSSLLEKNSKLQFATFENVLVMIWGAYRVLSVGSFSEIETSAVLSEIPNSTFQPSGLVRIILNCSKEIGLPSTSQRMFVVIISNILEDVVKKSLDLAIAEFRGAGWDLPKTPIFAKLAKLKETRGDTAGQAGGQAGDAAPNLLAPVVTSEYLEAEQASAPAAPDINMFEVPQFSEPSISDDMADSVASKVFSLLGPGKWKKKFEMEGNLLNQEIGDNWDNNLPQFLTMISSRHQQNQERTVDKVIVPSDMVYEALKFLQSSPDQTLKNHKFDTKKIVTELKKEILNYCASLMPETDKSLLVLGDNDEDAVDVMGMVFEIFLSERDIATTLKEKIVNIIPVYARVAIDDKKLFMNKKHPARLFLDSIVAGCEANEGEAFTEALVIEESKKAIKTISDSFDGEMDIFDEMSSIIQGLAAKNKENVQKTETRTSMSVKHAERLENADMETKRVFVRTLKSTYWPTFCIDLLEKYWSPCYKIILLQSRNEQSDPVKVEKSLRSTEKLLRDMADIGRYGLDELKFDVSSIHKEMIIMLASSGITEQAAHETALELWSAMDQAFRWNKMSRSGKIDTLSKLVMKTPSFEEKQYSSEEEVAEATWVAPEIIKDHSKDISLSEIPTDKELINYFSNLPLGSWVDFRKEDGSFVPVKLSFVSPISNRLVFVTSKGSQFAVEAPTDLAIMVKVDKVRLREQTIGEDGFGVSFKKAIEKLDAPQKQN